MWKLHEFADQDTLTDALMLRLSTTLSSLIQERGRASIALSGGNTPEALYRRLSLQDLNWSAVRVSLVDERWVNEIHADSNARMIKHTLLQNHARRATMIGMKTSEPDAFNAVDTLHGILARHIMPLDLVLLGMGLDGHTASWFPHARGLDTALADDCATLCCAVQPLDDNGAETPYARMTLSLKTVLSARHHILFITGQSKRAVLEEAFKPGPVTEMPVRALLHDSNTQTEIYYAPDT